jgi:DNA-binding MarR family transcriptional regulator
MNEAENSVRLSHFIDDLMVRFPIVARKILNETRDRRSPSTDMQIRLLEGLMTGKMTPTEISHLHCISKPNVTTLINGLIEAGFAVRNHDEKDRRVIYITITEKGKKLVQRKRKVVKDYMMKAFERCSGQDLEEIFVGMEKARDLMTRLNRLLSSVKSETT